MGKNKPDKGRAGQGEGQMEKDKINYPILVRLDKKTYAGLKALSFYAETPMRDIITSALKAYGLEKRLADAKKESVLYAP